MTIGGRGQISPAVPPAVPPQRYQSCSGKREVHAGHLSWTSRPKKRSLPPKPRREVHIGAPSCISRYTFNTVRGKSAPQCPPQRVTSTVGGNRDLCRPPSGAEDASLQSGVRTFTLADEHPTISQRQDGPSARRNGCHPTNETIEHYQ